MDKRQEEPIKGTWPDREKVPCRNCRYRDRTVVNIAGKALAVGVTRDTCEIYDMKPNDILFCRSLCPAWEEDT